MIETLKEISRLSLDAVRAKHRRAEEGRRRGRRAPASCRCRVRPASASAAAAAVEPGPAATRRAAASDTGKTPTDPSLLEPLQVEFAEEDTDKLKLRAVKTHGSLDIGQELEKLRAITASAKAEGLGGASRTARSTSCSRSWCRAPATRPGGARARWRSTCPSTCCKGLTDLRIHLGFDRERPRGDPARRRARHARAHAQAAAPAAAAGPRAQDQGVAAPRDGSVDPSRP